MKAFLNKLKTRETLVWCLDTLSLLSVLQYCVYRFLQSTMFNFYYSNTYKLITMGLLLVFGGSRYLYIIACKWKGKGKKERKKYIFNCGLAWLLALPFFYVGWLHDYKALIFLPVCCMCLYDMDAGNVCRWFFVTIGTSVLALLICSLSGTVRNIVQPWGNFPSSFGSVNTTDFASYFTFLMLIAWCGMRERSWGISVIFALLSFGIAYLAYQYTESKTALYCGILIAVLVLWDFIENKARQQYKCVLNIGKVSSTLSIIIFPLVGCAIIIFVFYYIAEAPWAIKLDQALSGRLKTIASPLEQYGIHAFGNTIESMHGNGGMVFQYAVVWSSGYTYIDVAYAMLIIRYGWIITAVFTFLWVMTTVKALRCGNKRIALSLFLLAIHAFSEARILDINYNIFLALPFASFTHRDQKQEVEEKNWGKIVLVGIFLVSTFLILPRLLAWLRAFFSIKKWNEGINSFYSFVFSLIIIITLFIFWKSILSIISSHKRRTLKTIIPLASSIIIFITSALYVNKTIITEKNEHSIIIDKENSLLDQIEKNATQPVYAAESEELYRRSDKEIESHLFSSDELGRYKGTLITDCNIEVLGITRSGGLYAQISEKSGVYSYDLPVIEALSEQGYQWSPFYSGKRYCNLRDAAVFNNMTPRESIYIKDGARIITDNMYLDQVAGTYEVLFRAMLVEGFDREEIGQFEVLCEAGERIGYTEAITVEDVNTSGEIEKVFLYQVDSSPKVSFAVTSGKDVGLEIRELSWRRIQ